MLCEVLRFVMDRNTIATFFLLVMSCTGIGAAPCPAGVPVDLVVHDTVAASAPAEAVNYSGEVFNMEWEGGVVVDHAIYTADGTSIHVAGADSGANMDGSGDTQLFTVRHTTLRMSNRHTAWLCRRRQGNRFGRIEHVVQPDFVPRHRRCR